MIIGIIKTSSIRDLEIQIEDLYSKQMLTNLHLEKGEFFTSYVYDGLFENAIKSLIKDVDLKHLKHFIKAEVIIENAKGDAKNQKLMFPDSFATGVLIAKYDSLLRDYLELKNKEL